MALLEKLRVRTLVYTIQCLRLNHTAPNKAALLASLLLFHFVLFFRSEMQDYLKYNAHTNIWILWDIMHNPTSLLKDFPFGIFSICCNCSVLAFPKDFPFEIFFICCNCSVLACFGILSFLRSVQNLEY